MSITKAASDRMVKLAEKAVSVKGEGEGLFFVLVALRQWGEDYCFDRGEANLRPVEMPLIF